MKKGKIKLKTRSELKSHKRHQVQEAIRKVLDKEVEEVKKLGSYN